MVKAEAFSNMMYLFVSNFVLLGPDSRQESRRNASGMRRWQCRRRRAPISSMTSEDSHDGDVVDGYASRAEEDVMEKRRKELYEQYFGSGRGGDDLMDELEVVDVIEEEERKLEEAEAEEQDQPKSLRGAFEDYFGKEGIVGDEEDEDAEDDEEKELEAQDEFSRKYRSERAAEMEHLRGMMGDDFDSDPLSVLPVNMPTEVLQKAVRQGLKPTRRVDLSVLAFVAAWTAASKPEEVVKLVRPLESQLRALALEAVLQTIIFVGYPKVLLTFMVLREYNLIPDELVMEDPFAVQDSAMEGYKLMGRIHSRGTRKMREKLLSYHPDIYTWTNQFSYGRVLSRDGLTLEERQLCGMAVLVGQDNPPQLAQYIRGAKRSGLSVEEIARVLAKLDEVWGIDAQRQALSILELMRRNRL